MWLSGREKGLIVRLCACCSKAGGLVGKVRSTCCLPSFWTRQSFR